MTISEPSSETIKTLVEQFGSAQEDEARKVIGIGIVAEARTISRALADAMPEAAVEE